MPRLVPGAARSPRAERGVGALSRLLSARPLRIVGDDRLRGARRHPGGDAGSGRRRWGCGRSGHHPKVAHRDHPHRRRGVLGGAARSSMARTSPARSARAATMGAASPVCPGGRGSCRCACWTAAPAPARASTSSRASGTPPGLSNDSGTLPSQRAAVINMSFGASGACDATAARSLHGGTRPGRGRRRSRRQRRHQRAADTGLLSQRHQRGVRRAVADQGAVLEFRPIDRSGRARRRHAPRRQWRRTAGRGLQHACRSAAAANITPTLEHLQGTSMAAPHVSGVIALMLSSESARQHPRRSTGSSRREC